MGSEEAMQVVSHYSYKKNYTDSAAAQSALYKLVASLQKDGYFTAHTAALEWHKDTLSAVIKVGKQFQWAHLSPGNLDPLMQEKSGFREKFFLKKPFSYDEIADLFGKILVYAENRGYPFASIHLVDVQVFEGQVYAALSYQPGPFITFGKLRVKGTKKVKPDFLAAYLGIQMGNDYDERKVTRIPDLVRALPYLTLTAPAAITFQNETADVILTLSERKSNEFNGMLNFFPSEGFKNKLLLTGELNILLNNLARSGKQFELRWQRLQVRSQRLVVGYQHPNLFHSPLDADIHFHLFKEDTLFVNRNLAFEVALPFGRGHRLFGTTSWQASRLTGVGELYGNTLANVNLFSGGLGYGWQRLDDPVFPRKGYTFFVEGNLGKKKILPAVTLNDTQPVAQGKPSWQQSVAAKLSQYHRIGNHWVLFHQLSGGWLMNKYLFLNDLYRLGGLHSIRGFYDNFFFASQYGLSNLELRLIFEEKPETYSCLFVFYDQAYLLKNTLNEKTKDHPAGLGIGINLTTSAGLFSFVYGLGRSESQPFNVNLSKIHFGYISQF